MAEDRQYLYQLIMSQLENDGYIGAASVLEEATLTPKDPNIPPSHLETLVQIGMASERETGGGAEALGYHREDWYDGMTKEVQGIDFDQEKKEGKKATIRTNYHTRFIATHKFACRCAAFSPDGRYSATGSQDTSIKLLDVSKIKDAQVNRLEEEDGNTNVRAVIRTFYGHTQSVNDLDFHPSRPLLASASRDCTIKFFDLQSSNKRAKRDLKDSHNVRSVKFHPSGEYLLAGTEHTFLHLYCCQTQQCYVARQQSGHHQKAINQVNINADGQIFASCSKDGTVKLWDGRNLTCTSTLEKAHEGREVYSIQFSKNDKYLLTGGQDCVARLWDLRVGRQLTCYSHSMMGGMSVSKIRSQVTFSYDETQVIVPDENIIGALVFDTITHEVTQKLFGHSQALRAIVTAPSDPHIITCSEDSRARFWVDENQR
ncbi:cleavage stimulation factor subunit 1-like [Schistocerca gregaria]|uniref:cleavage stimulation factor subunit 1-like n=1 Tax=Schistocerca gregaria TaxID=7010 RepID=UPI00211F25E4|nr:cleavage stimulation factor subunit 1-like [Schistocerca gregaria]